MSLSPSNAPVDSRKPPARKAPEGYCEGRFRVMCVSMPEHKDLVARLASRISIPPFTPASWSSPHTQRMIISIIWFLIIAAVVYWIFTLIPLPQPGKNIALAVIILLLLIYFMHGYAGIALP